MHLADKYKNRENEVATPEIIREIVKELERSFWWVKIKGKCYAPAELAQMADTLKGLKIGDIKQVDPKMELDRANEILVKMHERRIDFERRIKKYSQEGKA